jgi:hypothetical protein
MKKPFARSLVVLAALVAIACGKSTSGSFRSSDVETDAGMKANDGASASGSSEAGPFTGPATEADDAASASSTGADGTASGGSDSDGSKQTDDDASGADSSGDDSSGADSSGDDSGADSSDDDSSETTADDSATRSDDANPSDDATVSNADGDQDDGNQADDASGTDDSTADDSAIDDSATDDPSPGDSMADDSTTDDVRPPDELPPDEPPPGDWTAVAEPPPGYGNCEQNLFKGDESCTYRMRCDLTDLSARCTPLPNGGWSCACLNYGTGESFDYYLEDAARDSACQQGLPLCYEGITLETAEPECVSIATQTSIGNCVEEFACTVPITLSDGTHVDVQVPSASRRARCARDGDVMDCTCDGPSPVRGFEVYGADETNACDLFLGICTGDIAPGDAFICDEPQVVEATSSCSVRVPCGVRTELDPTTGVYAMSSPTDQLSTCTTNPGSGVNCNCRGIDGADFSAELEGESNAAMCEAVDALCTAGELFTTSGPVDCATPSPGVMSSTSCVYNTQVCYQAGQLGPYPAELKAPLSSVCNRTDSGQWSCSCVSYLSQTDEFLVSGEDGDTVCRETFDHCVTQPTGTAYNSDGNVMFLF